MHDVVIHFLGTQGNGKSSSRKPSCILLERQNQLVAIDAGCDLPSNTTSIILTNSQPNHIRTLKSSSHPTVYLNKFAHGQLSRDEYSFTRRIFWKKEINLEGMEIQPIPVIQSIRYPTSGFLMKFNEKRIAIFPSILRLRNPEILEGCDLYVGDGSVLDEDIDRSFDGRHYGHASIRTQLKWCQEHKIPLAIFTHFGKWASRDTTELFDQLSEEFKVRSYGAIDGTEIVINDSISFVYPPPIKSESITITTGIQDSRRKEIFLSRDNTSERWILQVLSGSFDTGTINILIRRPSNQTPFVLSSKAVSLEWIPPKGVSCLPSIVESSIPHTFKYWVKNDLSERLATRSALVEAIRKGEIDIKGEKDHAITETS